VELAVDAFVDARLALRDGVLHDLPNLDLLLELLLLLGDVGERLCGGGLRRRLLLDLLLLLRPGGDEDVDELAVLRSPRADRGVVQRPHCSGPRLGLLRIRADLRGEDDRRRVRAVVARGPVQVVLEEAREQARGCRALGIVVETLQLLSLWQARRDGVQPY